MRQKIAKTLEILFLIFMLGLCGIIFMAGRGNVPYIFGYRILQVITDSMEPTITGRTCIVIEKVEQEELRIGDIITFVSESPQIRGFLNTHRIIDVTEGTGEKLYITKGDASNEEDPYPVAFEQIQGRYVRELPFGRLLFKGIRFLSDEVNYFIVVMLPLLICCMSYMKQLVKALFGRDSDAEEEDIDEEGRSN